MNNPVMTASGTFGYGEEFADFIELSRIGGIIVKGTTLHKREGNPYPRMAETPSGMLTLWDCKIRVYITLLNTSIPASRTFRPT